MDMAECLQYLCSCILLVLQLYSSYATNQLDITIPPTDTVGCLGGLSTFYCRMDRNNITKLLWTVDSELVDDEIKQLRGITTENMKFPNGSEESYLHIQGLTINNEQYIGCEIFASVQPYFLADSGFFTVMAPPSVSNVRTNTSGINSVSWVAPGCLPLNYTYLVTVVKDFSNGSVTTYSSIDEQVSIYTPLCALYNISVMVTSSDHNSSAVTISYENPTEVKAISIDSLKIEFSNDNSCYGHLIGIITGNVCSGAITIGIYQTHQVDELLEVSTTAVQNQNYTKTSVRFQQTIGPLDSQLRGFVNLTFCHTNSSLCTDKIQTNGSFTTFHVQDIATTLLSNDTLEFSCLFATNSTAEGCLVVITADTYSCNYTQSRGSGPLLAVLPTGNNTQYTCTIVAYDIINEMVEEHYSVLDEILVAFNLTQIYPSTIQETVVETTQPNEVSVWLLSISSITQTQLSKSSDNPLMSPINTNIEAEEETNLPPSSVIVYATIVPVIVCVAVIFIVLCVVIVLVRRVQAKNKMELFTMYNANIEEVQRNPAYSTVHMISGRPVIDEVNSIYENPSYVSLKQTQKFSN